MGSDVLVSGSGNVLGATTVANGLLTINATATGGVSISNGTLAVGGTLLSTLAVSGGTANVISGQVNLGVTVSRILEILGQPCWSVDPVRPIFFSMPT